MRSDPRVVALSEIAADVPNAIAAGPFGSNLVSRDYVESGVPVIRGQNLTGRWVAGEFVYVSDRKAEQLRTNTARPCDIVFTQRGTLGQASIVPPGPFPLYVVSQSQMKLTVDAKKADLRFIYYACTSSDFVAQVHNNAMAAGVPHINLGILRGLRVPLPAMSFQVQAAEVLSSLDDRIDLLRQTNATLESIAQALFKSWFIDFDPVRAKAEGRAPEGMDAATAALFPAEFEESELGLIPKGWRAGTFGDLAEQAKGSVNPMTVPDANFEHYSLPAFDADQLPVFECGETIRSNKTRVPVGAVLQSKLNPHIPRVWLPSRVGERAVCSTEFLPWVARRNASRELVSCTLTGSTFAAAVRTLVTGTSNSHQRVKPDQVAALELVLAPGAVYDAFTRVARPLLTKVSENRWTARNLSELRDTLLPRLISGKLRLP